MSHPLHTWFTRHISHPLTEMYARLDDHQARLDDHQREQGQLQPGGPLNERPARPTPVYISWMPQPRSHAGAHSMQGR